jgi:hypothetical protein
VDNACADALEIENRTEGYFLPSCFFTADIQRGSRR